MSDEIDWGNVGGADDDTIDFGDVDTIDFDITIDDAGISVEDGGVGVVTTDKNKGKILLNYYNDITEPHRQAHQFNSVGRALHPQYVNGRLN